MPVDDYKLDNSENNINDEYYSENLLDNTAANENKCDNEEDIKINHLNQDK